MQHGSVRRGFQDPLELGTARPVDGVGQNGDGAPRQHRQEDSTQRCCGRRLSTTAVSAVDLAGETPDWSWPGETSGLLISVGVCGVRGARGASWLVCSTLEAACRCSRSCRAAHWTEVVAVGDPEWIGTSPYPLDDLEPEVVLKGSSRQTELSSTDLVENLVENSVDMGPGSTRFSIGFSTAPAR